MDQTIQQQVLRALQGKGSGMTPLAIMRHYSAPGNWGMEDFKGASPRLAETLLRMEADKLVYLHRDSTADKRMGGLPLPDGTSCTLVTLRMDQ